jgi:hypothetical protein
MAHDAALLRHLHPVLSCLRADDAIEPQRLQTMGAAKFVDFFVDTLNQLRFSSLCLYRAAAILVRDASSDETDRTASPIAPRSGNSESTEEMTLIISSHWSGGVTKDADCRPGRH